MRLVSSNYDYTEVYYVYNDVYNPIQEEPKVKKI